MNKKEKLSIKEINKQQFSSEEGKAIEKIFREWFQLQSKAKSLNEKYSIVTIDAAINLLKSGLSKLNVPGYEFINCFNITEVSRFQFLYDDCFNEAEAYDKKNGFADFRNGLNFYLKFLNEKTYGDKICSIIDGYKNDFERVDKEERYKWEAIATFQKHWNIKAKDFIAMLKSALGDSDNLLNVRWYYPLDTLIEFAEQNPEEARNLFRILFDESIDLKERYVQFRTPFIKFFKDKNKNHYQDLHAISVYLSFKYPEKYYIYKYTVVKEFYNNIGHHYLKNIDSFDDIDKYIKFCSVCNFVKEYVYKDTNLQDLSRKRLDTMCYEDKSYNVLTNDIVYFGSKSMMERFSWIQFYTAFADELLKYKNNRKALIDLIKKIFSDIPMKLPKLDNGEIIDIDPFTVYGLFNKGLTDVNRIKIIEAFKKELGIEVKTPTDFNGIPILNNMHATFYWFAGERKDKDIDNLWELFDNAINYSKSNSNENRKKLIELLDLVRQQQGIAWNITMGLFWIRPFDYINLDSCNRTAFCENRMIPPSDESIQPLIKNPPSGEDYFKILDICKVAFTENQNLSFPQLSHKAWMNENSAYWPSLEEYNPNLTKEKWIVILKDKDLTHDDVWFMLTKMLELGGESTCYKLAEAYGNTHNHYNKLGSSYGERILKKYNLPLCYDGDQIRYFPIPFVGRNVVEDNKKHYSWKLRPELKMALEELLEEIQEVVTTKTDIDKNIILYGPPGTGKTYVTARYAVAIVENKPLAEIEKLDYKEVLERYNRYKNGNRIEFTTFHQSYGYEEFIEGIKPVAESDEDSDIRYEVTPGLFKSFCDEAKPIIKNNSSDLGLNNSPTVWKVSLCSTGDNAIRTDCMINGHIRIGWDDYGPDITGETDFSKCGGKKVLNSFIYKMQPGDIVVSCYSNTTIDAVGVVTGDYEWNDKYPNYKRLRKVNWLVKGKNINIVDINNGKTFTLATVYRSNISVSDALAIVQKYSDNPNEIKTEKQNYVFIIDEINRGNISKIFGELITLIEPTKRVGQKEGMKVRLPYSQSTFGVPDNVYIIGTMNTADRSIAAIDTALRRRFAFKEMMPDTDIINEVDIEGVNIADLLNIINKRIEVLYDREHTIGHAYFTSLKDNQSKELLFDIFRNKIFPLLQEYFFEDYEKIQLVLGDNQKTDASLKFIVEKEVKYKDLFGSYPFDYDDKKTYEINDSAFMNIEAYKAMLQGNK